MEAEASTFQNLTTTTKKKKSANQCEWPLFEDFQRRNILCLKKQRYSLVHLILSEIKGSILKKLNSSQYINHFIYIRCCSGF